MKDRELTPDTKWIICMWDIRGEDIAETAALMKRSLKQVTDILNQCKEDGYYDKVRRHIEYFDCVNAKAAIEGFAAALKEFGGGIECER
ncbi:MAG: hypothetical protein E7416_03435 [Ruminococcaceae bacterium]|nr:hypothetical protein [Oscillospiraceae bacterium]